MLCQNCNEREANVKYTQIINGVKKEMRLCDFCAKELGIDSISFNMPIHFSNFLEDMWEDGETLLPNFTTPSALSCNKCGMTYDNFVETGKFGCDECYHAFKLRLDGLLKNIHGANRHVGRNGKLIGNVEDKPNEEKIVKHKIEENKKEQEKEQILERLQERLKQEIKEERYEDAAKTRDEIKKIK